MKKEPTQQQLLESDLITLSIITTTLSLALLERVSFIKRIFTRQLKVTGKKVFSRTCKIGKDIIGSCF
jgi:hypothetical protein